MKAKHWMGALAYLVSLSAVACQNYSFEELPTSVIREKVWDQTITISNEADILFVIDNSGSMVGEQLQLGKSFDVFTNKIEEYFGDQYRIAVITTGVQSPICIPCSEQPVPGSCVNDTGESGRFQEDICHNDGTIDAPEYSCVKDPNCGKVLFPADKSCFFNPDTQSGRALTGITGCGYERGLSAIKSALTTWSGNWNSGFLRPEATLVIIVVSDEDDCGDVGDIHEGSQYGGAEACYYAAKGVNGEGDSQDMEGKRYGLESVEKYFNAFMAVKNNRKGMVKFAAVVGVKDVNDLSTTNIDFYYDDYHQLWRASPACTTPDCTGIYCDASPGTRYIKLAQLFGIGKNGFVDTICQGDFSDTFRRIATFAACRRLFYLSEQILDPDLANILVNDEPVPRYSCSHAGAVEECSGAGDTSCSEGECVETWSYCPPSDTSPDCPEPDPVKGPGGIIFFADHYDPCEMFEEGQKVHIQLVYVTP